MGRAGRFIFAVLFIYGSIARPADLNSTYRAQRVSSMLSDAISGKYELQTTGYTKEDRELLSALKSPMASHLKVLTKDNQMIVQFEDKAAVLIEFQSDRILLNGSELKLNPGISLSQNLKNWALTSKRPQKNSKMEYFWKLMTPSAFASAIGDQAWEAGKNIVFTGLQVFESYRTLAAGSSVLSSAIAGGTAATVGTAAVVTTAAVVGALAVVAIIACEQDAMAASVQHRSKKSQELLNCYSKPLSWVGVNPRDRLYLQNISCSDKNTVAVEFESQTHQKIQLSLSFINGQYMRSMPLDVTALDKNPETLAVYEKWFSDQKLQKKMESDALYFQKLCSDPKKLEVFRKAVLETRRQGKVFTENPLGVSTGAK